MRLAAILLLVALLPGCRGCGSLPKTVAGCRDAAIQCRDDAEKARKARDPEAALAAAERATKLLTRQSSPLETDRLAESDARNAALAAKRWSDLAQEDKRLADEVNGLTAKSYRATRDLALKAVFAGLLAAARQMESAQPANPPAAPVREAAELAAKLAEIAGTVPPSSPAGVDWSAVAREMDKAYRDSSPEIRLLVAAGCLMGLQQSLALYELEGISPEAAFSPENRARHALLRGIACSLDDYPNLAQEQFDNLDAMCESDPGSSATAAAIMHGYLACRHFAAGRFAETDAEIGRLVRLVPNNELVVYLTGERLLADGKREEAAQSLEKAAQDTPYAALAQRLSARARDMRDGKPLGLAVEFGMAKDLLRAFLRRNADVPASRLKDWLEAAERLYPGGKPETPETRTTGETPAVSDKKPD